MRDLNARFEPPLVYSARCVWIEVADLDACSLLKQRRSFRIFGGGYELCSLVRISSLDVTGNRATLVQNEAVVVLRPVERQHRRYKRTTYYVWDLTKRLFLQIFWRLELGHTHYVKLKRDFFLVQYSSNPQAARGIGERV